MTTATETEEQRALTAEEYRALGLLQRQQMAEERLARETIEALTLSLFEREVLAVMPIGAWLYRGDILDRMQGDTDPFDRDRYDELDSRIDGALDSLKRWGRVRKHPGDWVSRWERVS